MRTPVLVLASAAAVVLVLGAVALSGAATPEPSIAPEDAGAPPAEVYSALSIDSWGGDPCYLLGQSLIESPDLVAIDAELAAGRSLPGKPLPASGAIPGTFDDVARGSGSKVGVDHDSAHWTVSGTTNPIATRYVSFVTPGGSHVWIPVGTLQRQATCEE
jgi:hypothetical protein